MTMQFFTVIFHFILIMIGRSDDTIIFLYSSDQYIILIFLNERIESAVLDSCSAEQIILVDFNQNAEVRCFLINIECTAEFFQISLMKAAAEKDFPQKIIFMIDFNFLFDEDFQ